MARPASRPVVRDGRPAGIRFDGALIWVWWGQDEQGLDVVAASGRQALVFESEAACQAACARPEPSPAWSRAEPVPVAAAGPVLLLGPEHLRAPDGEPMAPGPAPTPIHGPEPVVPGLGSVAEHAFPPMVTDLVPAQEWAAGQRFTVPVESALDLWNWGVDIARSTGRPFVQRGLVRDECYNKLVAAQVPWMFDRAGHRPTWDPAQLTALRGTLNQAVHLIREALR